MTSPNFYERLGCSKTASYNQIKRNFQELALKCHPDKQILCDKSDMTVSEEEMSEEFQLIMEAWNTLRDEKKRKVYDSALMKEECNVQSTIYANLSWNEFDFDGSVYSYICRCGDKYELDASQRTAEEISVQCNGCSLEIIIKGET